MSRSWWLRPGSSVDEELRRGQSLAEPAPIKRVLKAEDVPAVLARGGPAERPIEQPRALCRWRPGPRPATSTPGATPACHAMPVAG